jgi:EAL and modified HD-GYP domain-containing signal transduction protein
LKSAGYRLALSEWAGQKELRPLAALADYLRVDLRKLKSEHHAETMRGQREGQTSLIAYGVNSWEDHRRARGLGFRYFQGDFFLQPQLFRRREISGTRRNAMRLLQAIFKDPLDLAQIQCVTSGRLLNWSSRSRAS